MYVHVRIVQKLGTEQARSINSVCWLVCQCEVVRDPLRHMTAERKREKFNQHLSLMNHTIPTLLLQQLV